MEEKNANTKPSTRKLSYKQKINFQGYPLYPAGENIYLKAEKEQNVDPRDTLEVKESNGTAEKSNEKSFFEDVSEYDLEVPGSELDDAQENIGSKDEENNYYSLGGDEHNGLGEDKGE